MATGYDEVINFLLSEIALCGVQGASSADFYRFIDKYYKQQHVDEPSQCVDQDAASQPPAALDRIFHERVWQWVCAHPDIRITHQNEVRTFSLPEFEAAEAPETETETTVPKSTASHHVQISAASSIHGVQPTKTLLAIQGTLKKRLAKEENGTGGRVALCPEISASKALRQSPRHVATTTHLAAPIFSEQDPSIISPRLYASEGRTWQALTDHGIDLKQVPAMEFVLLSLIASRGPMGIAQPDLTALSGQDKRSVPHRTDELARKGYIVKKPVQSGRTRTSLCVHKRFVSQGHFLSSSMVEDVFQEGTFVLSGFVHLLYHKLKDAGIVTTRVIRTKLGVPMRNWNKRAVHGALIRLDQTGMVKRFRARRKDSDDSWHICIKVLREPRDEDVNNLRFRRQANHIDDATEELLDEDDNGAAFMSNMEIDMLDNRDSDLTTNETANRKIGVTERTTPQWMPEIFFANTVFDVIASSGSNGCDSTTIRDRIVGPFWRRPMDSFLTRLTGSWEKTQPSFVRHLAVIRDTRNTEEKKFLHYVYRTYEGFEKAVEAGEVHWEGVSKPALDDNLAPKQSNKKALGKTDIDPWGFSTIRTEQLVHKNGSATLSEARSAIIHPRKYGPRWDNALNLEIGYQNFQTPVAKRTASKGKSKSLSRGKPNDGQVKEKKKQTMKDHGEKERTYRILKTPKPKKKVSLFSITPEQRLSLGLKPIGRLTKAAERQIAAHRRKTGDPASLPDRIEEESQTMPIRRPLMTKEERIAQGLPPVGRLGIEKENEIRAERGLAPLVKKAKKAQKASRNSISEPPLLNKQQRLSFGWSGNGRLPQDLVDGLRQEREDGILLEDSRILPKYMDKLKVRVSKPDGSEPHSTTEDQHSSSLDNPELLSGQQGSQTRQYDEMELPDNLASVSESSTKRKSRRIGSFPETLKRLRTNSDGFQGLGADSIPSPSLDDTFSQTVSSEAAEPSSSIVGINIDDGALSEHAGAVLPSTPANASDAALAVVEVQHPLTSHETARSSVSLIPGLIEPVISSLSHEAQMIYARYTNRSSPGLYTNPFAKRKQARGRPRNVFLATFRFPELQDPEHLKRASESLQEARRKNLLGDRANSVPSVIQQIESAPNPSLHESADDPSTSKHVSSISQPDTAQQPHSLGGVESSPLLFASDSDISMRKIAGDTERPLQTEEPVVLQPPEHVPDRDLEDIADQPKQTLETVSYETHDLAARNTPTESESLLTQKSGVSSPRPVTSVESQVQEDRGTTLAVATTLLEPVEEALDPLPKGLYSAVSEVERLPPQEPRSRGKRDTITEGSAVIFRRNIIREIIDLCGGVFPDGGEIGRPFHTIWSQRHGHVKTLREPIASTVNATMRDMCNYPQKFGLKRMSFLTKHKNSPLTSTRSMITYANLTRNSPEVLQLASDMASFSTDKSHQYFPEQIRHLCDDKPLYHAPPVAPKDDSILLDELNAQVLANIREAQRIRRKEKAQQRRDEQKARRIKDAQVQNVLSMHSRGPQGDTHGQRARLASLNDTTRRRRVVLSKRAVDPPIDDNEQHKIRETVFSESDEPSMRERSSPESGSPKDVPLIWMPPIVGPSVDCSRVEQEIDRDSVVEAQENDLTEAPTEVPTEVLTVAPIVAPIAAPIVAATVTLKRRKRARIAALSDAPPKKKARLNKFDPASTHDDDYIQASSDESDEYSLSEVETEENEEYQPERSKKRKRSSKKRQYGILGPPPTLLERLTGLTGNLNDPIYQLPPERKSQTWHGRNLNRDNTQPIRKRRTDNEDSIDKYKKLCCTLVIASSMNEKNNVVEWSIVEKVYSGDKFFSIAKAQKLWTWMRFNMAFQLAEATKSFQSAYLEAYEDGKLSDIDEFETYDWEDLVRWAVPICKFPSLPLPDHLDAISKFMVETSSYESLDRGNWYKEKIPDHTRTRIYNRATFGEPLHETRKSSEFANSEVLKARSWVRANTATPQAIYDAHQAHDKFKALNESLLASVVGDCVEKKALRMRRLKRLLPGRNYNFTTTFAKKFSRHFELSDFMIAVKLKKDMDIAFAAEDPQQRFYSISHFEEDGSIMAIDDLISQGKVRLVPQLPPVHNEFKAPLPRLSVWGFTEGDYLHRQIDTKRMFWDVHVVPTADYQFGSPLQPLSFSPVPTKTGESVQWLSLPNPPLPGRNDSATVLPIWSSIDGQKITWPWWYRILNLVLQPLIFQPGATASQIFAHCPEHTTELFEVELVLNWLESIGAVTKIDSSGYKTASGFWAAFGDKRLDSENDWFGEAVKRKTKKTQLQKWREAYNARHSELLTGDNQLMAAGAAATEHMRRESPTPVIRDESTTQAVLEIPRSQYTSMHPLLDVQTEATHASSASPQGQMAGGAPEANFSHTPGTDVEMVDVGDGNGNGNGNGSGDVDAEGEEDDDYPSPSPV